MLYIFLFQRNLICPSFGLEQVLRSEKACQTDSDCRRRRKCCFKQGQKVCVKGIKRQARRQAQGTLCNQCAFTLP